MPGGSGRGHSSSQLLSTTFTALRHRFCISPRSEASAFDSGQLLAARGSHARRRSASQGLAGLRSVSSGTRLLTAQVAALVAAPRSERSSDGIRQAPDWVGRRTHKQQHGRRSERVNAWQHLQHDAAVHAASAWHNKTHVRMHARAHAAELSPAARTVAQRPGRT